MIRPFDVSKRGLVPTYRPGTHCPGCRQSQWIVRNITAECGCCGTALPMENARSGAGPWTTPSGQPAGRAAMPGSLFGAEITSHAKTPENALTAAFLRAAALRARAASIKEQDDV